MRDRVAAVYATEMSFLTEKAVNTSDTVDSTNYPVILSSNIRICKIIMVVIY